MRPQVADIDERRDDLLELLEADRALAQLFWEKLDVSWMYHESAMEGVVVSPAEMEAAFQPQQGVMEIGKASFLAELRRQRAALEVVKEEAKDPQGKLTLDLVKLLFETLTGGAKGKGELEYRVNLPLHRTYFHDILTPAEIIPELTALVDSTNTPDFLDLHPLQRAAAFHHRFMVIYPFTDLSGRVGRLLMNIMLMREGYLPAVIHVHDRQRYYESLKQKPRVLQTLMTEAIGHATDLGLRWLTQAAAAPQPKRAKAR